MELNPYAAAMSKLTHHQLLRVLDEDAHQYLPQALEAAALELQARKLSAADVARYEEENAHHAAVMAMRAGEPLEWSWRIVAMFLPGILHALWVKRLLEDGYLRKARDMGNWSMIGFVSMVVVAIASIILQE
jgi:hypothetical protein